MAGTKSYTLAVASHKGGTGRTTTSLALAWAWGRMGRKVALVDADPSGAARLIAIGPGGWCDWSNVALFDSPRLAARAGSELVVIDGPSLTDRECWSVLGQADGVLLTCLADMLSLRTLPLATEVLALGSQRAKPPELHGVLLTRFREDEYQPRLRGELDRLEGDLLLRPDVPEDAAVRGWALTPGADLPAGPARTAYCRLAEELAERLGLPRVGRAVPILPQEVLS